MTSPSLIEYTFTLTDAARPALEHMPPLQLRFEHQQPIDLHVGDLFSVEAAMPLVFVIARRHLHLVNGQHFQLSYQLDLYRPD